jgi:adenylate kinase family enzyme
LLTLFGAQGRLTAGFPKIGGDMKVKANRIDRWIESRVTRLMSTGNTVLVDQVVRELNGFFSLDLSPIQSNRLRQRINRIRERVKKRVQRHKRLVPNLATQWMVDQRLIERWVAAGWISLQYPRELRILTEMFLERDYVRMINPENIPIQHEEKIWGNAPEQTCPRGN